MSKKKVNFGKVENRQDVLQVVACWQLINLICNFLPKRSHVLVRCSNSIPDSVHSFIHAFINIQFSTSFWKETVESEGRLKHLHRMFLQFLHNYVLSVNKITCVFRTRQKGCREINWKRMTIHGAFDHTLQNTNTITWHLTDFTCRRGEFAENLSWESLWVWRFWEMLQLLKAYA